MDESLTLVEEPAVISIKNSYLTIDPPPNEDKFSKEVKAIARRLLAAFDQEINRVKGSDVKARIVRELEPYTNKKNQLVDLTEYFAINTTINVNGVFLPLLEFKSSVMRNEFKVSFADAFDKKYKIEVN